MTDPSPKQAATLSRRLGFALVAAVVAGAAIVVLQRPGTLEVTATPGMQNPPNPDRPDGDPNALGSPPTPGAAASPEARVTCQAITYEGTPAISCAVAHRQGFGALNVCWDTVVHCQEGVAARAHRCQPVAAGATETVVMLKAEFAHGNECTIPSRITVEGLSASAR